ncbi:MAG: homocysteine S-methyltransferase family protein [Beijerinckiaceae bacterium]
MGTYRNRLPQLDGGFFLTDGGLETTLIFLEGVDLPHFAAIDMHARPDGEDKLRRYFTPYIEAARRHGAGFVLETATWRASRDWAEKIGYGEARLAQLNRRAVAFLDELRAGFDSPRTPMPISAAIGPRGDGYNPSSMMSASQAQEYHAWQIDIFAGSQADCVTAFTLGYSDEAIGVARAAACAAIPCVISFTTETDGRLPSGETLRDAIARVDDSTAGSSAYYMINCAHPAHFAGALAHGEDWTRRIRGLRANASMRSHAELDEATELDSGDPDDLGQRYRALMKRLPHVNVIGGCCGTDHRHIEQAARFCAPARAA